MVYAPPWESLTEALKRVMEATGASQSEAQADLCRAIADGAVAVRACLGKHAVRSMTSRNTVLEGLALTVPTSLKPGDLHWSTSRPLNAWLVPRGARAPHGFWYLEWIKVSAADVTKVFSHETAEDRAPAPKGSRKPPKALRTRPASERAERAVKAVYHGKIPTQAAEPNSALCKRIGEWLKTNGLSDVSNDTILRATGRRKYSR